MADNIWTQQPEQDATVAQSGVNRWSDLKSISASVGITLEGLGNNKVLRVISATAGDTTVTADPPIEAAGSTADGKVIEIWGTDDTRTVTLSANFLIPSVSTLPVVISFTVSSTSLCTLLIRVPI